MKKFCLFAIAALLLLSACNLSDEERRQRALDELNRNSELPFALTLPEAELGDTDGYWEGAGWGCRIFRDDDIYILLSGYPDVQDTYHITEIQLLSPKYDVFGLRVGDAAGRAAELLEPRGYELVPDVRGWGDTYYIKDGVIIHLEYHEGTISDLTAYVQSTNVENVDF